MQPPQQPASGKIELVSDGDGLAVIGDPAVVERFLASEGLPSRQLELPRLRNVLNSGGALAQAGSEIAANSGRWVKLTEESAAKLKKYKLMKGSSPGTSRAVLTEAGKSKGFLEIVRLPGSMLSNPSVLAGVGGIMAQLAMQQAMDEITDYLGTLDKKLDSVLRAQLNQVLSRMDAVDLIIREAMSIRASVGRVSEVTWSKVQSSSATIIETQAFALRQLTDLADQLEQRTKINDLAEATKNAESEVQKWLAVLARCVQLHDAVAVLELDRVLDTAPDELDRHRMGLKIARHDRLELLSSSTRVLLDRMRAAADTANTKVLQHPRTSPALVRSSNRVTTGIIEFHATVGIEASYEPPGAKRWGHAVAEVKDKALDAGGEGVDAARRFGSETYGHARSAGSKLSDEVTSRTSRWRRD